MADEEPKPFLTVYTFDRDHKEFSYSSFVTRLHFRLRYARLPYEDGEGTRNQAPKSKIPYVRFNETGEFMGDSELITKKLIEMGKLEDLNAGLSVAERVQDLCLRSMIEEKMYYLLVFERWYENFRTMRDEGPFGHLAYGIRHVAVFFIFRYCQAMLYFQGTGRHSLHEVKRFQTEAIQALADLADAALPGSEGEEPFWILGGTRPTEADFMLFGYLAGVLVTPTQPHTTSLIKQHKALASYVKRIQEKYFPDFHELRL